jgi:predicted Rossmann fold nucleotide-binding protein DprA/Smf involved in DNA uptake
MSNELLHLASIGSRVVSLEALTALSSFLEKVCIAYSDASQSSLVIVSGLAKGIDRISHEVGLANAHTVGVLPSVQ